jgi:hypothetical protein
MPPGPRPSLTTAAGVGRRLSEGLGLTAQGVPVLAWKRYGQILVVHGR